ncbi:MAG: PsbP-related protein [Methanobacterium sp.]
MMKKLGIFGIISILVLIVAMSGCSSTNTYNANGISFNYPSSWQTFSTKTLSTIVAVGDPKTVDNSTGYPNTYALVQKATIPSGSSLKQVYDAVYAQYAAGLTNYKTISENTTTVDGTTAYVNIHSYDINGTPTQEEAVWIGKNSTIYVILCGALPGDFASQQSNFNMIINSFKVIQ